MLYNLKYIINTFKSLIFVVLFMYGETRKKHFVNKYTADTYILRKSNRKKTIYSLKVLCNYKMTMTKITLILLNLNIFVFLLNFK